MKRILSLVLVLLLCLVLCACASNNVETTSRGNVDTQKQEDDIPSNELLQKDLEEALRTKNEYATVIDYVTVKSLTGDGSYEITLNVYAETKYADWSYEVDMDYRKYDQGWMVDDVSWVSGNYEQVRIPDANTMHTYAKEYLLSREDYYEDYFLSVENGAVNLESDSTTGANKLVYTWVAVEDCFYYDRIYDVTSWWEYNSEIDNWDVLPDSTAGSLGYCVFDSISCEFKKNLDLTGVWDVRDQEGNILYKLEFTNFSLNEFDVQLSGAIETPEHFTLAPYHPFRTDTFALVFTNEDEEYITFMIHGHVGINVGYWSDSSTLAMMVPIEAESMNFS